MRVLSRLIIGASLVVGFSHTTLANPIDKATDMMKSVGEHFATHGMKPILETLPGHMQSSKDTTFKYLPSYMTIKDGRDVTEADFEDPAVCAGCHPRQYAGWKDSMHAKAFVDPIFQKLWHMAEVATDGKLMNHCGACHTPIGILTGSVVHDKENEKFTAGPLASKGVSCDVCHTITKTNFLETSTLEHGNASFEMDPQGPGGTKRGPLKNAQSPYHKTEYSDLHKQADFCGNCHNIFHAENGFPIERTYDEWKYSPYARAGIVCQDCHMNSVEIATRVAKEMKPAAELKDANLGGFAGMGASKQRDVVHDHSFIGGNAVVTALLDGKDSKAAAAATARLQSAAELDVRFEDRKDGLASVRVQVTNVGAGHSLPTSLTDVREIWVHIVVKDDKGNVIYENGQLDSHGELDHDNVTIFNAIAINAQGNVTHFPWEVTQFIRNTTIPPKGNNVSRYTFALPKDSKGVTAEVKLNYRSYGQHLADVVLGEGTLIIPIIEMESATVSKKL